MPRESSTQADALPRASELADLRHGLRWHALLACVALVANLLQSPSCFSPDAFTYAEYGKLLLHGKSLYSEIILDKPVLTPILYALPQLLVRDEYWIFKFCLAGIQWLEGYLILKVVRPRVPAAVLVSCFVLFYPLLFWDWNWPSTEHLSNPFVLGVLLICWRVAVLGACSTRAAVSIGLLLGAAFLIRQTTATTAIVPLVTLATLRAPWGARFRALLTIGVAGAATLVASVGVVYFLGDVDRYLYTIFVFPRTYANVTLSVQRPSFSQYLKMGQECQIMSIFTGAAFVAALSRQRVTLWAGLAAGFLSVIVSPRTYDHYVVAMFPSIAITLAAGLGREATWPRGDSPLAPQVTKVLACALLAMLVPFWLARMAMEAKNHSTIQNLFAERQLVDWLDRTYPNAKSLWTVAPMKYEYIVFASKKSPAHSVRTIWELDWPEAAVLYGGKDKIEREYLESPPEVIVLHEELWDWLETKKDKPRESLTFSHALFRALMERHRYRLEKDPFVATSGTTSDKFAIVALEEANPPREDEAAGGES